MADNKLEEIIDLLAEYGGFNREYLRDKLLTFANDGRSETKNKMEQVARLFIKELGEEFSVKIKCWNGRSGKIRAKFTPLGLKVKTVYNAWELRNDYLADLLIGRAVIIDEGGR